jgi:formamidopyrimidine-DNA glycosylase
MPELPDITVYAECLAARCGGQVLRGAKVNNPFLLRTVSPPLASILGRPVRGVRRLGKRLVLEFEGEHFLVIHLMIAGRLRWWPREKKAPGRGALATFEFDEGWLVFTEAGTKRRASLHLLQGEAALAAMNPGGVEVLQCSLAEFAEPLRRENHTLKRSLTDPHLFSGIGNAYSDEILHRAKLSPLALSQKLDDKAIEDLYKATREVLTEWTDRLRCEVKGGFPDKVTAFHDAMAVHGRYGLPCPVCGSPVQRIVYAENEANYCARCQTGGKVLADRALSKLLHDSWPKHIDELG